MLVRILALVGSPRRKGNTDLMTDALLQGAEEHGAEVQKIFLEDYNINPIRDCRECRSKGGGCCSVEDDAFDLIEKMFTSDIIVFATPLYWYTFSAQMKAFLDRWSCDLDKVKKNVTRKKGFLVHVRTDPSREVAEPLIQAMNWSLNYVGMDYLGDVEAIGREKGLIADNEENLKRAYESGKYLASQKLECN